MGEKKSQYKKVFKGLEQNISNFLQQSMIPSDEQLVEGFNYPDFWSDLSKIVDKLCFEANKISLAWISPPVPPCSDMQAMGGCLELACVALVSACCSFPASAGYQVTVRLTQSARTLLETCQEFVRTLTETVGTKFVAGSHPLLRSFAKVMEKCEAVKHLPTNNKEAALNTVKDQYDVLRDALGELEEARSNNFMDDFGEEEGTDEHWKDEDKQIINPSVGLIKTSVALVKKIMVTIRSCGREEGESVMAEYDSVCEVLDRLSPVVDDLALSLYPPIHWSECKAANERLKQELENCIQHVNPLHFMTGEDAIAWSAFMSRAVTHNFSEIQRVFVTQGLAEIKISQNPPPLGPHTD